MERLEHRTITDLVDANYIYASVLYYFGIEFYHYSELTLKQACESKGLEVQAVIEKLEHSESQIHDTDIENLPVDLVVEYLKHAHYIFIKKRMPYISRLIENLTFTDIRHQQVIKDLKFVFPLFVEDFIHHIYEEEDTLFSYIGKLSAYTKGRLTGTKLYYEMEKTGLSQFASEHEEHDDEMEGIRQITGNYSIDQYTPLHLKVIFSELKTLERELETHADVENNILFPKALQLESEVVNLIKSKIIFN